mmetsp:Transcript_91442/g.197751  ORF Transcript_91442/g.197751 Transcript_91442/m.197751 type:complete len:123 (-) Transcript_91442:428-796(-)
MLSGSPSFHHGPLLVLNGTSTILVEPKWKLNVTREGNMLLTFHDPTVSSLGPQLDAVQTSLFSHRFMSIAEQMGIILQSTALSVNCKERLDFSCALFDQEGSLLANAPHLPVHLGSMSDTVK